MKKSIIFTAIFAIAISTSVINPQIALANNNESVPDVKITTQATDLTPQDIEAGMNKLKLANEYKAKKDSLALKTTTNSIIKPNSWGSSNSISVRYYVEQPYLCGPASAQIAIIAKLPQYGDGQTVPYYNNKAINQNNLAVDLLYSPGAGTPLSSRWASTLNLFMPTNNYSVLSAPNITDWRTSMKNGIIYTVDKGYAVVVDTHMQSSNEVPSPARVNSAYSYLDDRGRGCYHYIVANGYNDTSGNDLILITDCNDYAGFPHSYWCSSTSLANVSKPYGIVY